MQISPPQKTKIVILISLVQFYWRFIWLFNVLFWNKIPRWHIVTTFFSKKQFETKKMRSVWKYYFYRENVLFDFKISYLPNLQFFLTTIFRFTVKTLKKFYFCLFESIKTVKILSLWFKENHMLNHIEWCWIKDK